MKSTFGNNRDTCQELAENLLGDVEWQSAVMGFCVCPGAESHTTKAGPRDCRVTLDGTPTIFCFHQNCAEQRERANRELREAVAKEESRRSFSSHHAHEESITRQREKDDRRAKEQKAMTDARSALPKIIHDFSWPESEALAESPLLTETEPSSHAKVFLREMFLPDQIVWTGKVTDSGKPKHASRFRPVSEWLACDRIAGPFTCASIFKRSVFARSNDNVELRPYIVLEGDVVDAVCAGKIGAKEELEDSDKARNRAACLAVLNWLRCKTPLVLRAVVDAANKSMHGWFDMPDKTTLAELKIILPGFGFDPSVLRPSQPVRLPGVVRPDSGRWQRLVYLNPSEFWK